MGAVSIADKLAKWTCRQRFKDLPSTVVHEVKRRVIDSLGCAVGAFSSEPGRIARKIALSIVQASGATVLGTGKRCTMDLAAFSNGTLVRYLDYNDTYLSKEPAHPSDNIPAALAVAESERLTAKDLITAVIVGYEVQCRLADAASLRARGWDHVTYGAFSSACLTSWLLKSSEEQTKEAVSLAGVANNALRQTRVGKVSMWKASAFANAAKNGIFAAYLAKNGLTGPSDVFEGQFGFFNLVSGAFKLPAFAGEGSQNYKILDTYIKFYPAEYHAQTGIETALQLRPQIPSVDEISNVRIEAYNACVDIIADEPEKWKPETRETADHSLPYCVAVALLDGNVTADSFNLKHLNDKKVRKLMGLIKVNRNKELDARYPQSTPLEVSIELRSGKTVHSRVEYARGHPRNPMTDQEVEAKFRSLAEPILGEKVNAVLSRLWKLNEISDLTGLLEMFNVKLNHE